MESSRQLTLFAGAILMLSFWGCSGTGGTESGSPATGGIPSSIGGSTGIAGSSNAGGVTSSGGTTAIAGSVGAGGAPAGGTTNAGGSISSGGAVATGGATPAGDTTSAGTGGALATGGSKSTGGVSPTGGTKASGGNGATGGTKASGGNGATGGTKASGGNGATGGTKASGGTTTTGGSKPTGGSSSAGGTTGAGGDGQTVNCGGTAGSSSCPEGNATLCGMLEEHNVIRAAVTDASPALPPLVWDCTLAAFAQAWADTCPTGHNPDRKVENQTAGENMAQYGGQNASSAATVVDYWAGEKPNYTYSTNSCASGKSCGHYTQLVWRNTTAVGCGVMSGCPGQYQQVWICDYLPAGNYSGQKPY